MLKTSFVRLVSELRALICARTAAGIKGLSSWIEVATSEGESIPMEMADGSKDDRDLTFEYVPSIKSSRLSVTSKLLTKLPK